MSNLGVFAKAPKAGEMLDEGDVTLDQVQTILKKVDINPDGYLDKVEFMLLALDRSLIFSEANLAALFDALDEQRQARISLRHHVLTMLLDAFGEPDKKKVARFFDNLSSTQIVDPDVSDFISKRQFFLITRDVFGINTFEITEAE